MQGSFILLFFHSSSSFYTNLKELILFFLLPILFFFNYYVFLLNYSIFGNLSVLMQRIDSSYSRLRDRLDTIDEFSRLYSLPHEMSRKLGAYALESWRHDKGFDMEGVTQGLPSNVRAEVLLFVNKQLVQKVPLFKSTTFSFPFFISSSWD